MRYGVIPKFLGLGWGCILIFLWVSSSCAQEREQPIVKSVPAFRFEVNEQVEVDVFLNYTEHGDPFFYSAHLETDVCSDGLCKPISITVRWDLLGRFLSYHTDETHKLTKFDHVELTAEDHAQLHKILADTASVLRDYEVEDMIDTSTHIHSLQVDAVTRPTSTTFDGTTVEGALYTVYTLWHFTNGPIRRQLVEHTRSILSDSFVKYILHSGNRDYIAFIFKTISPTQYDRFIADIIELVGNHDEYIPHFALAQLRDNILSDPSCQRVLLAFFLPAANPVKNALLTRLAAVPLDSKSLEQLLSFLPGRPENQVIAIFSLLENNKSQLDKKLIKKVSDLASNSDYFIASQAKNLLKRIAL